MTHFHGTVHMCATRLFQGGQNVKLVKEVTGPISDAVNKYIETSNKQCMGFNIIIQGNV